MLEILAANGENALFFHDGHFETLDIGFLLPRFSVDKL